jgi:hypothetical protein
MVAAIVAAIALVTVLVIHPFAEYPPATAAVVVPSPLATEPVPRAASPTDPFLPTAEPSASSVLVVADLDGLLVLPALAHREPLAVSVDDARAARPQSGFNAASVVWQVPVDGYESRYLLVFQEGSAASVGPVRSARIFLAHWAAELHAGFAHYGGDLLTLGWLATTGDALLTNIDGLGTGNPAFHRVATREAPHNAYASTTTLWQVGTHLGAARTIAPDVHLMPFRDDAPSGARGIAQSIAIPYHTVRIGYTYDPTTNAYLRSVDGTPQLDPLDGLRVMARTVAVLYMPFHTDSTIEPGHNRPVLGFIGSGVARIYTEGTQILGRWSKLSAAAPTILLGPDGRELPLVRGRIFFQVVPLGTSVSP